MRPVHLGVLRMNLLTLFAVLALLTTAMPPLSVGFVVLLSRVEL
jgi:hypothetical protein